MRLATRTVAPTSDVTLDEFARGSGRGYPHDRWYEDDFSRLYLEDALILDPRFSSRDRFILIEMYDGADEADIAELLSMGIGTARTLVWRVRRRAQTILMELIYV